MHPRSEVYQVSLVDNVRQYIFEKQQYPLQDDTEYEREFTASLIGLQHVISTNAFNFKDYVPYQLEKGKMRLFPEFKRHFMKSFMLKSEESRAYCIHEKEKFQSLFNGSKKEIVTAVKTIEMRFSEAFFQCLSPKLQEIYNGWVFTREVVETRFIQEIREVNDMVVPIRKGVLYLLAKDGNVVPLVEFLMAFETGEQLIWFDIATAVGWMILTEKQTKFVSKKLIKWKKETRGLLKTRIYEFISDLEEEGILPIRKGNSATNEKKRKPGGENSRVENQGKAKVMKPATQRLKADGTPYLPFAEWIKLQKEKKDMQIPKETSASLQKVSNMFALQDFNKSIAEYVHLVFKWDGGSSIHVVKDKSILINYRPDAICHSVAAYSGKTLHGAGDLKIRLADGSVGILKDVFHDEELNANLLSTNAFTPFYHGIVDNKLIRFDTGEVIGYVSHGTPEVQVELLDFEGDVELTLPERAPPPTFLLSRSYQPVVHEIVQSNNVEGPNVEGSNVEGSNVQGPSVEEPHVEGFDVESGDDEVAVTPGTRSVIDRSQQTEPSKLSLEWHAKLGHPGQNSFEQTKKILQLKNVYHVPMIHCDTCLFGKAKRSVPKVSPNLDPVSQPSTNDKHS